MVERYGCVGPMTCSISIRFLDVSFAGSDDRCSIGVLTGCAFCKLNCFKAFLVYVD